MAFSTVSVTAAPYGSWKSPITGDVVSGATKDLGGTAVDGRGRLIWLEFRPLESGRGVLVLEPEKTGGEAVDITPKEFGVRTLAQEYGGAAFTVSGDVVFFANYNDQRLYKQSISSLDEPPLPLTPDYGGPVVSYADGILDARFNRFLCVREDRRESSLNPPTTIVSIALGSKDVQEPVVLVGGSDFYAYPRLDSKSERIAWIQWNHPNMPWDKTELWVGYISENGEIYKRVCVAGHDPSLVESPTEPKWSSEVTGDSKQHGKSYLGIVDVEGSKLTVIDFPCTDINNITSGNDFLYVEGASEVLPSSVAKDIQTSIFYFKSLWFMRCCSMGGYRSVDRAYRERLLRQWGIVDVNDCCSCATYLVESGKVDKERLCIMGGSAGGYTTLAVLAFRNTFQAGASLYGIADFNLLRAETHKFESHYVENLVGGDKEMYERSPINHVDDFSCPIIIFQGLEDKVVPPDQAEKIYQAVKEKGVPVALVEYEGEQHGFRKAENIKNTIEQEMVFFARLIGHFDVADDITPIKIDNFDC
ncbi:uncharacterized protein HKW66_Vig0078210 [Vigna angularis]|uniref:Peptidase S9 prolyl oligopeptidase catalytic domain-containing protein n=1 Tax=Phaseolus angularis TaxID=3914 RepID=A0A8T0K563_PHAAN|nr:uncharacterized protein HKW66_Vig0078210 [Vigna angularis]